MDSAPGLDSAKTLRLVLSPCVVPLVDSGAEVTGRSRLELPLVHLVVAISRLRGHPWDSRWTLLMSWVLPNLWDATSVPL